MSVTNRFEAFVSNITLTDAQKAAGSGSRTSVVKALNAHYWGVDSGTSNSKYVGSWAKLTRIRPPRDVDVIFTLPTAVYHKFEGRSGNKQSQVLQEVKAVLLSKFPYTDIRGDGPVVKIPFAAYNVELAPAFSLVGGGYWVCMTDSGGYYKKADYDAEFDLIKSSGDRTKGNTRNLIKMMKCWQGYCEVPLKSFWIELIAVEFLNGWEYRDKSKLYYDFMVRDFLKHLESKANGNVYAPGTYESMYIGSAWLTKATTARQRAEKACNNEADYPTTAGEEWQKIFGADIPKYA